MKAIFDGDEHEIEERRIGLVFNKSHGESRYPERFEIAPEFCAAYFEAMPEISDVAAALFRAVVRDFDRPVTKAELRKCQPCFRELAGRLEATVRLMVNRVPFVWKYPENGLHPMYQGNIADVVIALTDADLLRSMLHRFGERRPQ
jgi:hypothetical protein